MKNTAKFRRSKFHLWLVGRLGSIIWLDELSHLTEEQWEMLRVGIDRHQPRYDFGPGTVFTRSGDSSWVKIGLFENATAELGAPEVAR